MRSNKFKNRKYLFVLLILFISIGFAALATSLAFTGSAKFGSGKWDVHFDNIQPIAGSVSPTSAPVINDDGDTIDFSVVLEAPGEYYSFYVDVVNDGTVDAMIESTTKTILNSDSEEISLPDYAEYTVTYDNGNTIEKNHKLAVNSTVTYKITIKFSDDADLDKISQDGESVFFKFKANFVKATKDAIDKDPPVCKRATTLHTEECTNTDDYACKGAGYTADGSKGTTTITYGNLGTSGEAPKAGDAFDCDVDGNGTFDEDERFYYISDSGSNDGYATLIYYNNVTTEKYHTDYNNHEGPVALLDKLPSTDEWTSTGLNTNMTRQILNENGVNTSSNGSYTLPNFTYTNRAARLLSTQEVESACGITVGSFTDGELDSCGYLLENTYYATGSGTAYWWLETPRAADNHNVWNMGGKSRYVYYNAADDTFSVRPAIEVDKTKIAY